MALAISVAGNSFAADLQTCKRNPQIAAACYRIHGRLDVWNGTPSIRLWHIGTHHMLGIEPPEGAVMPDILLKQLQAGNAVYGDYVVCPLRKERAGRMGAVCIESASNLFVQDRANGEMTVRRIPGRYSLSAHHH